MDEVGTVLLLALLLSSPDYVGTPRAHGHLHLENKRLPYQSQTNLIHFVTTHTNSALPGLGCKIMAQMRKEEGPHALLVQGIDGEELRRQGWKITAQIGQVIAAAATRSELLFLEQSAHGNNWRADSPQSLRPVIDVVRKTVYADQIHLGAFLDSKIRGNDVLIGAYDSGIDITHPAFLDSSRESRILAVWDETKDLRCNQVQIQAGNCLSTDSNGHGTSSLSVAAGDDSNYRGIAPDAAIAVVASQDFEQLIPSLAWLEEIARQQNLPLVVNLSLSGHEGPHDGSSLESIAINAYKHLVVTAAGNEGNKDIHISGELSDEDTGVEVPIALNDTEGRAILWIEIWGAKDSVLESSVQIRDPQGRLVASSSSTSMGLMGRSETLTDQTLEILRLDLDSEPIPNRGNQRPHSRIEIEIPELRVLSDKELRLSLRIKGRGSFDVWLDAPAQTEFLPSFTSTLKPALKSEVQVDVEQTISDIATASAAIAVSSQVNRSLILDSATNRQFRNSSETGQVSSFSSYGPSGAPQRTGPKPDLIAPGEFVVVAQSKNKSALISIAEHWTISSGTSIAAPVVSGAAALLLSAYPVLSKTQLRDRLLRNASLLPPPLDPRNGAGLLNIESALSDGSAVDSECGCQTFPEHHGSAHWLVPWLIGLILLTLRPRQCLYGGLAERKP